MPHTPPLFSPTSNPRTSPSSGTSPDRSFDSGASSQSDLPQELLQNGWRRCWSTRERRWYYFNKLTQEAKWEPPVGAPDGPVQTQQQQPYRKFVPSEEWNLNLPSNVRMPERVPLAAFAPHPDMEILRSQAVKKLRMCLLELCHLKESKCFFRNFMFKFWLIILFFSGSISWHHKSMVDGKKNGDRSFGLRATAACRWKWRWKFACFASVSLLF